MSDTPRTDSATFYADTSVTKTELCVTEEFARILERELAALRLNLSVTMEELGEMRDRAEKAEAKIDALMFEYCPEEMSLEQIMEWKKHQRPVQEG
jgi:hypothetical protein